MPRVEPLAARAYPWYVRLILALQRRKYGVELEPARLWGRMPRTFLCLTLLYRSIDRAGSPLEPALRALLQVRVSQINWCAFCVDSNSAAALERAVPPDKLVALESYAACAHFSERERAALAFAEAATDPAKRVDDGMLRPLARAFRRAGHPRADRARGVPEPLQQVQCCPCRTGARLLHATAQRHVAPRGCT